MGILERKWLIDNYDFILSEMEYYRTHSAPMHLERASLWKLDDESGRLKIETP